MVGPACTEPYSWIGLTTHRIRQKEDNVTKGRWTWMRDEIEKDNHTSTHCCLWLYCWSSHRISSIRSSSKCSFPSSLQLVPSSVGCLKTGHLPSPFVSFPLSFGEKKSHHRMSISIGIRLAVCSYIQLIFDLSTHIVQQTRPIQNPKRS